MKKQILFFLVSLYSFVLVAQQAYYNDVDLNLTGITLRDALATKIINTHTNNLTYSNIWDSSMITDVNPMNSAEVLLIYGWENGSDGDGTNDRERGINMNGGSVGDWNREHVYSNSLGTPDLDQGGTDGPPYADAHNLRPCDTQRNSSRGNKLFSTGSGNSGSTGTNSWYPGDEWKGDVARMMMYMYLRYDTRCLPSNVGIGDSSATPDDMIDLFLQWNADDPVSTIEEQRNNYHGNTTNTFAQGNRNPFIDNPRLATRIWGGPEAEDIWGIYTSTDTEAPTVPMNLIASNITTFSIDLSWNASTDNVGVSSYDVFVDGNLEASTSNTNYTITGLASNASFSLTVLAKDIAENASAQSTALNVMTLEDTEAPTVPMNIMISNETDVSFKVTWDASTDNTAVTGYDVYVDGSFNATTSDVTYTVNSLTASTTYSITVLAKDAVNNMSAQSIPVDGMTTDGTGSATELFISEYVEGSSNNKTIEIANITGSSIDLSLYNLRRQSNGTGAWSTRYDLTGILVSGDVVVVINGNVTNATLIAEADIVVPNNAGTNFGEPLNFNGDDPVGLFKDETLIDIVGEFDFGGANFAQNTTLRRKSSVTGPNISFDEANEWDSYPEDTVDDVGMHSTTLSTTDITWSGLNVYPNPTSFNYVYIRNNEDVKVEVFNILGKKIKQAQITESNPKLDLSSFSSGIYLLKISNQGNSTTRKIIKQ